MANRSIKAIHEAYRDDIADLITRRPVPSPALAQVDPFLFLNHHGPQIYAAKNNGLPFGPHPHRGFETVTFILDGSLAHHDTGGHESIIEAGGVQWMTAGSGLVHAELSPASFQQNGGPMEILQLWVNLPSRLKMTAPAYTGLQGAQIPRLAFDNGKVSLSLIAGELAGQRGPFPSLTQVFMSSMELAEGGKISLPAPKARNVLLYVVRGAVRIADQSVQRFHLIEMNNDGDEIAVEALESSLLLFGHADPIGEPVVSHGPFVMNTREEIETAIADYRAGKLDGVGLRL